MSDEHDRTFEETREAARLPARGGDPTLPAGDLVDEWGRDSFPASDPPARWAGVDVPLASRVHN